MGFTLTAFTLIHVVISLVGIGSGFVVLYGFLARKRLNGSNALFLASTIATSVTGFFFPVDHFMPSHAVGILSLLVLGIAVVARYRRLLVGRWCSIYVVSASISLYLNVFVLVVQLFGKVPVLKAAAPTQSEPPFLVAQCVVLALFVAATICAVIRVRKEPVRA